MNNENIKATIINIGTELTEGLTQDLHGKFIASHFNALGIITQLIFQIPDDYKLLVKLVSEHIKASDILVITGGLGPTSDDISREAVSESLGISLDFDEALWEKILQKYPAMSGKPSNRKQAYVPNGFIPIENSNGTAPGLKARINNKLVYMLPGPPRELRPIFLDYVLEDVSKSFSFASIEKMVCTSFLVPESQLEDVLAKFRVPGINWSTRAENMRIVFILRGGTEEGRRAVFNNIRDFLGDFYIKEGEIDPCLMLFNELKKQSKTFSCAESCTGGLVSRLLTDFPGSSDVFWGGLVVYSYDSKSMWLDVPGELLEKSGAVSEDVVKIMAEKLRSKSATDISLAVSGIAGPGGGSEDKPVGTVCFAVSVEGQTFVKTERFTGNRGMIRKKAAIFSILLCHKALN